MVLKLTTFSRPVLTDEGGHSVPFSEKGLTALAYLVTTSTHRIGRAELAEFLWGDPDQTNTLGNLRQLLARVKTRQAETGTDVIGLEGSEITLRRENLVCDLDLIPSDISDNPLSGLENLLSVVSGEFLSGFAMSSQTAQLWLESQRAGHVVLIERAVVAAAERTENFRDERVRLACVRLLSLDPFNLTAHRLLLRVYSVLGQKGAAHALFARYRERVYSEFGVAPEPELQDLMRRLFPSDLRGSPSSIELPAISQKATSVALLPRLLILPPQRVPGNAATLAAVLVEDVTIALCQARAVAIVAPHTARQVARIVDNRREILDRHSVDYAFECELREEGRDLNLFGSLADVRNDELIWAARFNVSAGHLSRAYREIIQNLVLSASEQIERHEFAKIGTSAEPNAYQNYLQGLHHLRRLDLTHIRRARKMFRSALHIAPDFSNALSGLARTEHLEWLVTARGDAELLSSSERHSRLAIKSDPRGAGGYHQLGVTYLYRSAFDESLNAFEEAEKRAPSHADLIADYADTLVHASDPDLAIQKIEKAIDLNPLCPDVYWWTAAGANYCLEKFETALNCINKMDDKSGATRLAAACWGMLGNTAKARTLVRKTMQTYPDFEVDKWLSIMPLKDKWHKEHYREGLKRAGFR